MHNSLFNLPVVTQITPYLSQRQMGELPILVISRFTCRTKPRPADRHAAANGFSADEWRLVAEPDGGMHNSLFNLPVVTQITPYLSQRQMGELPILVISHPKAEVTPCLFSRLAYLAATSAIRSRTLLE
jgi:hypothetical protein